MIEPNKKDLECMLNLARGNRNFEEYKDEYSKYFSVHTKSNENLTKLMRYSPPDLSKKEFYV